MISDRQQLTVQSFILDRGEVDLLVVSGPDSSDFLNRLSTLNFKSDFNGPLHGAFLNGQAKLISFFTVWKKDEKKYFFIEKEMFQKTKEYLEQMHFAENLKIEIEKFFCVETRGNSPKLPSEMEVEAYNWGLPGKYYFDRASFEVKSILQKNYDQIRASFGFPKPTVDIADEHILIEGPFENFVDRNKGCYPGQEVIEKIYTYGRVARKIKKLSFSNLTPEVFSELKGKLPFEIESDGNKIGTLTSIYQSSNGFFGLGTIKRHIYEKQNSLVINLRGQSVFVDLQN